MRNVSTLQAKLGTLHGNTTLHPSSAVRGEFCAKAQAGARGLARQRAGRSSERSIFWESPHRAPRLVAPLFPPHARLRPLPSWRGLVCQICNKAHQGGSGGPLHLHLRHRSIIEAQIMSMRNWSYRSYGG